MEDVKIKAFLFVSNDCGNGYGNGSGYGYGSGDGSGNSYGYGNGNSYGCGDGYGSGYGCGYGCGYGNGYGDGVKSFSGKQVYMIDKIATIIDRITMGVAKGHILNNNLTLTPCYVVKQENVFAHGETLHKAREALMDKFFEDMPEEKRIAEFVKAHENGKTYSDKDFFDWHHRLTGSCEVGRMAFAEDRGLADLTGSRTVQEFISLCENSYGGETIKKLKEYYPEGIKQ